MNTQLLYVVSIGFVFLGACGGSGGGGTSTSTTPVVTSTTPGDVVAITRDGKVITFSAGSPQQILTSHALTGLQASEVVLGIDTRPSTGEIYGVGSSSRLYRIDPLSGVATAIGTNAFTPELRARTVAFDIDPVADDVRLAVENERNFRLDLTTGVYAGEDAALAYAAADPNFGLNPDIAGLAYTNAFAGAATTTLYGIDAALNTLVRIGDADGTPAPGASGVLHTIGSLGIDAGANLGFDVTPDGRAFFASTAPGATSSEVYTLDLATGGARLVGTIGGTSSIRAMTVRASTPPRIFGITESNALVTFVPGRPGELLTTKGVTGLLKAESIVAIDARPNDGLLYGVSNSGRLYRVDVVTAVATAVNTTPISSLSTGSELGFDFNPLFGVGRIVNTADENIRVNPLDGTLASVDHVLSYDALDAHNGSDPSIAAIAYSSNVLGGSATTLYGIDSSLDTLVRIGSVGGTPNSPNDGSLTTIGALGTDTSANMGLDIDGHGVAFAVLGVGGTSSLFTIDLTTGAARSLGAIGGASPVIDIAVEPAPQAIVYGLDDANTLVSFEVSTPSHLDSSRALSGLASGESMLAIDFRPATGDLVGISNTNRAYRIDRLTGAVTAIGPAFAPAPSGARISADVDPLADELRVVSDGDTNLSLDLRTGATLDVGTNLSFAASDPYFGTDPAIVSIAHGQNFLGASSTSLFGIDTTHDVLTSIGAATGPASGELVTIGALGVSVSSAVGFDIAQDGLALVSDAGPSASTLYRVDLATGTLVSLGAIAGRPLRDLAILPRGN
jgi:trimeric autotransporter adhesin